MVPVRSFIPGDGLFVNTTSLGHLLKWSLSAVCPRCSSYCCFPHSMFPVYLPAFFLGEVSVPLNFPRAKPTGSGRSLQSSALLVARNYSIQPLLLSKLIPKGFAFPVYVHAGVSVTLLFHHASLLSAVAMIYFSPKPHLHTFCLLFYGFYCL